MKENSGKALEPIANGGAAMKSFSPSFLGPGSTERLLVCSFQWQWSVCTLNCFDWCCLPSVWKSFLCKPESGAWVFTAPATAVSEEFTNISVFAGDLNQLRNHVIQGRRIIVVAERMDFASLMWCKDISKLGSTKRNY